MSAAIAPPSLGQAFQAIQDAEDLLREGYYIVNRRHGIVACLPEGKTGTEALGTASGNANWANQISEEDAGEQYLCIYAFEDDAWIELDSPTFKAFLQAGGRRYNQKGVK